MPIERWSDTIAVVHLADDPQFGETMSSVEESISGNPIHVVLDFAAVHFINSSNIAQLLRVRKKSILSDRRMILCAISTQVWGTFLVTGLDNVFDFSDSVTTALATLQMGR